MVDDGGGLVPDLVASKVDAPTEIDIFTREVEGVVEESDLVEGVAAVGDGRAAAAKDALGLVVLPFVFLPDAAIGGGAIEVVEVTGRVKGVSLVEKEDFADDTADLGIVIERSDQLSQPIGVCFGVVVEEDDDFTLGRLVTGVAGTGEAGVVAEFDEADFGVVLAGVGLRAIGGTVIDQDRFEVGECLLAEGVEAVVEVVTAVPVGNDDGGERVGHLLLTFRNNLGIATWRSI